MKFSIKKKLPLKFYKRDLHTVAKELLGKYIVKEYDGFYLSGRIVEVEAYDGNIDEAAHSFSGKTKRNQVMFEGAGKLYVYFTYGMHFCANVVTGNVNDGKAILIRAVEPIDGIDQMALNRFGKKTATENELKNLCSGPGKFCKAFNIDRNDNGTDLTGDSIFIINATKLKPECIVSTKRIGIKKSVDLQWRYYIKENKFVSKR
jgi:DNA-3-methyladenine glycosylase